MTETINTQAEYQAAKSTSDLTSMGNKQTLSKPLITTKPVSTTAAYAAQLSIASGVLFAILLLGLHILEPEFDPTWRFVSEYMLGTFGWIMHLAFLGLATSLASASVAIFSQTR